jgi:hypothetical protein
MKLSQKLLALSGVAFADYACCPYDDYGIPDPACQISEKTPFDSLDTWNGHSCKAWEANVDASFDGNDNSCTSGDENWSSCGFQRHFSWVAQNNIDDHVPTGPFKLGLNGNHQQVFSSILDMNQSDADGYTVGGSPFLSGVCKLFIPVPFDQIASVSVAGVHISGLGWAAYDADVRNDDAGSQYQIAGSAYCFSVVNPSEFVSNYNGENNYLSNGNVAGFRDATAEGSLANLANDPFDDLTSQTARQAGVAHVVYGGPSVAAQTTYEVLQTGGASSDIVMDGANFDVVAHFKHDYCTTFWNNEDMQMAGDWGNTNDPNNYDYPDGPAESVHTHTDTTDKRFVTPADMILFNDAYTMTNGAMTRNGGGDEVRWPNVGSYAGFYSFVACSTPDTSEFEHSLTGMKKFIYLAGVTTGCSGTVEACHNSAAAQNFLVSSVGNSMWRYECENTFTPEMRFNIRQAGSNIRNCGPGTMPDNEDVRCSWNWNFIGFDDDDGSMNLPQAYFMRSNPKSFEVWDQVEQQGATAWANPINLISVKTIKVTVNNRVNNANGNLNSIVFSTDVPDVYIDNDTTTNNVYQFDLKCNNIGTTRDDFPDCYQGEEIHINAAVTYADNFAGEWTDVMADPWLTEAVFV